MNIFEFHLLPVKLKQRVNLLSFPVRAENWILAVGTEAPSSLLDTVSLCIRGFVHMSLILVFEQHEATGELEMRTRAHCLGNSNNKNPSMSRVQLAIAAFSG